MIENRLKKKSKIINNNFMQDVVNGFIGSGTGRRSSLSDNDLIINNLKTYLLSNNRYALSYAYVNFGILQTLIDQPVDDAFRGGVEFISEQLDNEIIKDVMNYWDEEGFLNTIKQTAKWSRLFGGSGIVIGLDGISTEPIDYSKKSSELKIYSADLWELFQNDYKVTIEEKPYVPSISSDTPYSYYGVNLHKDRVIRCQGKEAPSIVRPQLKGWGMSEIERVIRAFNQIIKQNNVIYEMIDEAKFTHYGIEGLNDNASIVGGVEKIVSALQSIDSLKSYLNSVILDKNDTVQQIQLNYTGLVELMKELRIAVACECRFPVSKLFGVSITGLNGGEDDIENYNSMIDGEIRGKYDKILIKLFKITAWYLKGINPDDIKDLKVKYRPLRIMSSEQEENVKNQKFGRIERAYSMGLITDKKEIIQQLNYAELLPMQAEYSDIFEDRTPQEKEKKSSFFGFFNKNKKEDNTDVSSTPKDTSGKFNFPESKALNVKF